MFPSINPTSTRAWKDLTIHATEMKNLSMKDLFANDKERYTKYAHCFHDILVDFSKNIINEKTIQLLIQLANECKLKDAIEAMYEGDLINETEKRSVLHVALKNFSSGIEHA